MLALEHGPVTNVTAGQPIARVTTTTATGGLWSVGSGGYGDRGRNDGRDGSRDHWVRRNTGQRGGGSDGGVSAFVAVARIVLVVVAIRFPDGGAENTQDDGQGNDIEDPKGLFPRVAQILDECAAAGSSAHLVLFVAHVDRCGVYKGDILVLWLLLGND